MIVVCDYCDKEFNQQYAWYKRSKHHCCSRKCADKLKIRNSTKTCKYCSKKFHKKYHQKSTLYCSAKCCSKMQMKDKIKLYCNICGRQYFVNEYRKNISRFCSRKCLRVYTGYLASQRIGEKNSCYKGFDNQKRTDKSKLRTWANIISRRDEICILCGSSEKLQAHHIKSYKEYPELKFDISNGILLCNKCHALQHENDKVSVRQLILS